MFVIFNALVLSLNNSYLILCVNMKKTIRHQILYLDYSKVSAYSSKMASFIKGLEFAT